MNIENAWRLFMKNIILVLLLMLVFAFFVGSGVAQQKNQAANGNGYNPQVTYSGDYKSTLLFFRFTKNDGWRRLPHMDRLRSISCQDALNHLNSEGKWQGSLNPDGSCGTSSIESPQWAIGNLLNYDESLGQAQN
jgi:hypothetical protein